MLVFLYDLGFLFFVYHAPLGFFHILPQKYNTGLTCLQSILQDTQYMCWFMGVLNWTIESEGDVGCLFDGEFTGFAAFLGGHQFL